jgi:mono/diheme cytochrome c family protein
MKTAVIKLLGVAIVISGFSASGRAQELDPGKKEFLSQCAICHGADGKGNGFLSEELKTKPANLTVLAKNNNGVFPLNAVYEVIDGRKSIRAHGTREMPIWGLRYASGATQPKELAILRTILCWRLSIT